MQYRIRDFLAYFVVLSIALAILIGSLVSRSRFTPPSVLVLTDSISSKYLVDTLHINTANVGQLKGFGFTNNVIVNIMLYREAGGVFLGWDKLKSIHGLDTVKFALQKDRIMYDFVRKSRPSVNPSPSSSPRYAQRIPRISLYYTPVEQLLADGVLPAVCDTLLLYRDSYVIRGSISLDTLQHATSSTISTILRPHLSARKSIQQTTPVKADSASPHIFIELNSASVSDLCTLYMVKEKTAQSIIRQRERLGGFVSISQLKDIYFVGDPQHYDTIASQLYIDTTLIRTINVNTASIHTFEHHPYSNKRLSLQLYRLRRAHKHLHITDITHFRRLFDATDYDPRLEHYLTFQ